MLIAVVHLSETTINHPTSRNNNTSYVEMNIMCVEHKLHLYVCHLIDCCRGPLEERKDSEMMFVDLGDGDGEAEASRENQENEGNCL